MNNIDIWEFPECCSNCGLFDYGTKHEPYTYLDVKTRLCADCFSVLTEEN